MGSVLKKRNPVAESALCGALQNQTRNLIELSMLWCISHLCEL